MTKQVKNVQIIKLYAITICTIYQECLEKARLLNNEGEPVEEWSLQLYDKMKLDEEVNILFQPRDWRTDYHNYLRDRYNFALKNVQHGNSKIRTGYNYEKFLPLLIYASRQNYAEFDQSFDLIEPEQQPISGIPTSHLTLAQPIQVSVLYTPSTFGRTSIFRNPDKGEIYVYNNGDIVFEGESCIFIKHNNLKEVSLHAMYGDDQKWVKISYEKNKKHHTAYFAEAVSDGNTLQLVDPLKISDLLKGSIEQ